MNDRDWTGISIILEECFKHPADRPWSERRKAAYRSMLSDYTAEQVTVAVRKLAQGGVPFLPAVPEIVAAIEHDPGIPTWPEAARHVFATPATLRRLGAPHPALAVFIDQQGGIDALRLLPVEGEEGKWERKRLREQWAEHVEQWMDRKHHAVALGRGDGGPRRLDPISSLGMTALGSGINQEEAA